MSDAKRFEDWIIFDAHEFQYPNGDGMSEDALAFLLDLNELRAQLEVAGACECGADDLCAIVKERDELRAKWESVPWDELQECAQYVDNDDDPEYIEQWAHDALAIAQPWLAANAPKEVTT